MKSILACLLLAGALSAAAEPISWVAWSPAVFAQARREHRFVLLDLEAVWCHWCHVMDEKTYTDPNVIALVKSNYIAVRVDQDSRPDLAERYQDYGWPATVVFNADGGEIVKRQGYLPPSEMATLLKAIIVDPTPGPSVRPPVKINFQPGLGLTPALRDQLRHKLQAGYDAKMGGWGFDQKFMNCDNVEYCLAHAAEPGAQYEKMARQTLAAQLQLIDPAWGGVYQYSTDDDWKHPHFEKIMQMQAGDLRTYALAFGRWHDKKYERAAFAISRYLEGFLTSPEGAFYTSQDADLIDGKHSADYFELGDQARRRQGMPRIDKHVYARENGWAIEALVVFSSMTGESSARDRALRAAEWNVENRSLPGGGFRHDEHDAAGPYLGDTLAMGRAFLGLYEITADRVWLDRSQAALQFVERTFAASPGFRAAAGNSEEPPSQPDYSENLAVAHWANLMSYYLANAADRAMAESALRWIAAPEVAGRRFADVGGVLLANEELNTDPIHITVIGKRDDPEAQSLWKTALGYPASYRRIEFYDHAEGHDLAYPSLPYAAAFFCTKTACSSPVRSVTVLATRFRQDLP